VTHRLLSSSVDNSVELAVASRVITPAAQAMTVVGRAIATEPPCRVPMRAACPVNKPNTDRYALDPAGDRADGVGYLLKERAASCNVIVWLLGRNGSTIRSTPWPQKNTSFAVLLGDEGPNSRPGMTLG
jgi:hypothetical protein